MSKTEAAAPGAWRDAGGRFAPGNPGKPRGARNRVTQDLAQAILADFKVHRAEVLSRLRRQELSAYARLVARLLPGGPEEVEEPEPAAFDEAVREARLAAALAYCLDGHDDCLDFGLERCREDPQLMTRVVELLEQRAAVRYGELRIPRTPGAADEPAE